MGKLCCLPDNDDEGPNLLALLIVLVLALVILTICMPPPRRRVLICRTFWSQEEVPFSIHLPWISEFPVAYFWLVSMVKLSWILITPICSNTKQQRHHLKHQSHNLMYPICFTSVTCSRLYAFLLDIWISVTEYWYSVVPRLVRPGQEPQACFSRCGIAFESILFVFNVILRQLDTLPAWTFYALTIEP